MFIAVVFHQGKQGNSACPVKSQNTHLFKLTKVEGIPLFAYDFKEYDGILEVKQNIKYLK